MFVDASVFMGMHADDDATRRACVAFMAGRFEVGIAMAWEQVGRCDDLVWRYPREVQDAYYPFMDVLHSTMPVQRRPYQRDDLRRATDDPRLAGLPLHEALAAAMAANAGQPLVTVSPRLQGRPGLCVQWPSGPDGACFPAPLDELYQRSLVLRVETEVL